jgi:hypothetical protein
MPVYSEWFCGFCNASCQRRTPGDPVSTGYVRQPHESPPPRGWFKIPENGGDYACGKCEASHARLEANGIRERHPTLAAIADLAGSAPGTEVRGSNFIARNTEGGEAGWPSITSPFGVPARAPDVDTPADQDVREDG